MVLQMQLYSKRFFTNVDVIRDQLEPDKSAKRSQPASKEIVVAGFEMERIIRFFVTISNNQPTFL